MKKILKHLIMNLKLKITFLFICAMLLHEAIFGMSAWRRARDLARSGASTVAKGVQTGAEQVGRGAERAYEGLSDVAGQVRDAPGRVYEKSEQIYDAVRSIVIDIKDSITKIKNTVSSISSIKSDMVDEFAQLPDQAVQVTKKPIDQMVTTASEMTKKYQAGISQVGQKDLKGLLTLLSTTQHVVTTMLDSTNDLFNNAIDQITWRKPIKAFAQVIISLSDSVSILVRLVQDITVKLVGKVFGQESNVQEANNVLKDILSITSDVHNISQSIADMMKMQ